MPILHGSICSFFLDFLLPCQEHYPYNIKIDAWDTTAHNSYSVQILKSGSVPGKTGVRVASVGVIHGHPSPDHRLHSALSTCNKIHVSQASFLNL